MSGLNKKILVTGATGQQGGAVARSLLASGWEVKAFTRNKDSMAAITLADAGAELFQGDNDGLDSLIEAMSDVYGVYSVQPSEYSPGSVPEGFGYRDEVRQGKNVADAVRVSGVQHIVYSSVAGVQHLEGTRNYSKWEIEEYIRELALPATILRPAWFMENFSDPMFRLQTGVFATAINPDVRLSMIAVDDIGGLAEIAFNNPSRFIGKEWEIAGDDLTPSEIVEAINGVLSDRQISYFHVPIEMLEKQNEEAAKVFKIMNKGIYQAAIPAPRDWLPGMMDFRQWLQHIGREKFQQLFNEV